MAPCGWDEVVWQILLLYDQRVITDSLELLGDSCKESRVIVLDVCNLSVDGLRAIGDLGAMNPAYALMSQTHAKDWDVTCLKNLCADPKVLR